MRSDDERYDGDDSDEEQCDNSDSKAAMPQKAAMPTQSRLLESKGRPQRKQ